MQDSSLTSAFEADKNGGLKNWVISYLNSTGNNHKLAQIIQDTPCRRVELIEASLDNLTRICGPETGMAFFEDTHVWETRITALQQGLDDGAELPPLIVTDFWTASQISDGAHRHEALKRNGFLKYWIIFLEKE